MVDVDIKVENSSNNSSNNSNKKPSDLVKKSEVQEKQSISDEFLEELDEQEKEIFLKLKSVLIDTCELLEFEAVTEDSLDDFVALISYTKNGIINIQDDGILVKLRRDILNDKGEKLTDCVKILYEKNESREKVLTKKIKIRKKNVEDQKEFTRACLAASFDNVMVNGVSKMLSVDNTRKIHTKDYMLLLTCYNFFRN